MDRNARVLIRVFSVLCGDCVFLTEHWLSGVHATVLEHDCRVTEYEVYGSVYVTLAEELAL